MNGRVVYCNVLEIRRSFTVTESSNLSSSGISYPKVWSDILISHQILFYIGYMLFAFVLIVTRRPFYTVQALLRIARILAKVTSSLWTRISVLPSLYGQERLDGTLFLNDTTNTTEPFRIPRSPLPPCRTFTMTTSYIICSTWSNIPGSTLLPRIR